MSIEKILRRIEQLFRKANIPYMLVGGFAVAYWGYPRQSLDIDIVLGLDKKKLDLFLKNAKKLGFIVHPAEVKMVLAKGNRFVMEYDDLRIDCWLPKTEFNKFALDRCKRKILLGQAISLIGAEDLIISKLMIARARDLEDVKTVLLRQGKRIDLKYLRRQSLACGVSKHLNEVA
jgi:predicted nucleotidyltransferase